MYKNSNAYNLQKWPGGFCVDKSDSTNKLLKCTPFYNSHISYVRCHVLRKHQGPWSLTSLRFTLFNKNTSALDSSVYFHFYIFYTFSASVFFFFFLYFIFGRVVAIMQCAHRFIYVLFVCQKHFDLLFLIQIPIDFFIDLVCAGDTGKHLAQK